jgi:hypothetical protein
MEPKMLILVEGEVRAIFTTGGMSGGVQIRSVDAAGEEHGGVAPVRVTPELFSTLRLVSPSPGGIIVADEAVKRGRDLGLFDFHGNIKDEAHMRSIVEELEAVEDRPRELPLSALMFPDKADDEATAEAQAEAHAQATAEALAESEARDLANAGAEPHEPTPGETQAA